MTDQLLLTIAFQEKNGFTSSFERMIVFQCDVAFYTSEKLSAPRVSLRLVGPVADQFSFLGPGDTFGVLGHNIVQGDQVLISLFEEDETYQAISYAPYSVLAPQYSFLSGIRSPRKSTSWEIIYSQHGDEFFSKTREELLKYKASSHNEAPGQSRPRYEYSYERLSEILRRCQDQFTEDKQSNVNSTRVGIPVNACVTVLSADMFKPTQRDLIHRIVVTDGSLPQPIVLIWFVHQAAVRDLLNARVTIPDVIPGCTLLLRSVAAVIYDGTLQLSNKPIQIEKGSGRIIGRLFAFPGTVRDVLTPTEYGLIEEQAKLSANLYLSAITQATRRVEPGSGAVSTIQNRLSLTCRESLRNMLQYLVPFFRDNADPQSDDTLQFLMTPLPAALVASSGLEFGSYPQNSAYLTSHDDGDLASFLSHQQQSQSGAVDSASVELPLEPFADFIERVIAPMATSSANLFGTRLNYTLLGETVNQISLGGSPSDTDLRDALGIQALNSAQKMCHQHFQEEIGLNMYTECDRINTTPGTFTLQPPRFVPPASRSHGVHVMQLFGFVEENFVDGSWVARPIWQPASSADSPTRFVLWGSSGIPRFELKPMQTCGENEIDVSGLTPVWGDAWPSDLFSLTGGLWTRGSVDDLDEQREGVKMSVAMMAGEPLSVARVKSIISAAEREAPPFLTQVVLNAAQGPKVGQLRVGLARLVRRRVWVSFQSNEPAEWKVNSLSPPLVADSGFITVLHPYHPDVLRARQSALPSVFLSYLLHDTNYEPTATEKAGDDDSDSLEWHSFDSACDSVASQAPVNNIISLMRNWNSASDQTSAPLSCLAALQTSQIMASRVTACVPPQTLHRIRDEDLNKLLEKYGIDRSMVDNFSSGTSICKGYVTAAICDPSAIVRILVPILEVQRNDPLFMAARDGAITSTIPRIDIPVAVVPVDPTPQIPLPPLFIIDGRE